jgi:hypothetical protein
MTAIAVAEQTVAAPLALVFARFIDFSHWDLWMPKMFAPVTGPARALQTGDKFKVGIGQLRLPLELKVIRLRPEKEICWRGGNALLLQGDHSFLFSYVDGRTVVRSEEPLVGLLSRGPVGGLVEKVFVDSAREILARFAAHVAQSRT